MTGLLFLWQHAILPVLNEAFLIYVTMNGALRARLNQARKNTSKGRAIKDKTKNQHVRMKIA